jgi:AraC-like DNA-binding protein
MNENNHWLQSNFLMNIFNEVHLKINHAYFGRVPEFKGLNTLPINRLYLALETCGTIQWGKQKEINLTPGSITFMPYNIPLSYSFQPGKMIAFHFNIEIFPNSDLFYGERNCLQLHNQQICENVFETIKNCKNINDILSIQQNLILLSSKFLDKDFSFYSKHLGLIKKHKRLINYIDHNLDANLTVDSVATYLDFTRDQLSKSFKRDLGFPLKKYISHLIIRKASEQLLLNKSVKEVADELKFSSQFYFSRFFKKHTNISPSLYKVSIEHNVPVN